MLNREFDQMREQLPAVFFRDQSLGTIMLNISVSNLDVNVRGIAKLRRTIYQEAYVNFVEYLKLSEVQSHALREQQQGLALKWTQ